MDYGDYLICITLADKRLLLDYIPVGSVVDVVLAYKVLQAEKDALSTSLAALGASVQRQADADVPKEELKVCIILV